MPHSISTMIFTIAGIVSGNQYDRNLLFTERSCRAIDPSATYFCPVSRYCLWEQLDKAEQDHLVTNLNYSEKTWEYDESVNEEIELTSFDELGQDNQNSLTTIGFDEDSHDCCHGHYQGYDWSDFDDDDYAGVKRAWELLGYNRRKWNLGLAAEFDDYSWDELSDLQRLVLTEELCYTRELWNGRKLSQWPDSAIVPGSSEVEADQTPAPSPVLPSMKAESIAETQILSSTPLTQPSDGTDIEVIAKDQETSKPLDTSTSHPTSRPSFVPSELSFAPSKSISLTPSKQASVTPSEQSSLTPSELTTIGPSKQAANPETFAPSIKEIIPTNEPVNSIIDLTSGPSITVKQTTLFPSNLSSLKPSNMGNSSVSSSQPNQTLSSKSPSESPSEAFYIPSTHPSSLPTSNATHILPVPSSIPSSQPSQTQTTFWPSFALSMEASFGSSMEQSFGSSMEQSFESSSLFPEDNFDIANALSCGERRPNMEYYCPSQRYCAWDVHNDTVKDWLANSIGYGRFTWNFYRINAYELTDYDFIPNQIRQSFEAIGYDVDTHECCNSHYETYDWSEFDFYNMSEVRNAWEIYGYNQNSWDNDLPIENEEFDWDEFSDELQFVLTEYLCYSKELWDETPLEMWPEESILPGSYVTESFEEGTDASLDSPDDQSTAYVKNLSFFSGSLINVGIFLFVMLIAV